MRNQFNNGKKPLKRNPSLRELSRDHHSGLLLCWKIRTGLDKNIETERIKKYADHFFATNLEPHFQLEEKILYPLLGDEPMVKKALDEHAALRSLFKKEADPETLKQITLILNAHIRFEEREMFNRLQETVDERKLAEALAIHDDGIKEPEWNDPFWE
jgi:hypothetical protein